MEPMMLPLVPMLLPIVRIICNSPGAVSNIVHAEPKAPEEREQETTTAIGAFAPFSGSSSSISTPEVLRRSPLPRLPLSWST